MTLSAFLNRSRPGSAVAGLAAIFLTTAGCALVNDVAYGMKQTTHANPVELAQERGTTLDWMPSDARSISRVASTREDGVESILFTSATAPTGCTETERMSAPTMSIDDAPDVYDIDEVFVCGRWAVAAGPGDAYVAWTPAAEADAS
ncbi:MAG: hypothetical protein FJW64_05040 [Actinobacteria bacterium]|nr:hypothetical protein [Actinomycetota bacterium]